MLELLSQHENELDLATSPLALQRTRDRTADQLRSNTATIEIINARVDKSEIIVNVRVQNKTGHKFPTGFPPRRAWIHLRIVDSDEKVIFESGKPGTIGEVSGNASDNDPTQYEPHYLTIQNPDQVQIYELILEDLNREVTYTLLGAAERRKDNRLLPVGFSSAVSNSDISVVGRVEEDLDFSDGQDNITYRMSGENTTPPYTVQTELLYQTVSYRFWKDLLNDKDTRQSPHYEAVKKLQDHNVPFVVSAAQMIFP